MTTTERKFGDYLCANCGQPLWAHCQIHLIPCCPGKCPGPKRGVPEAPVRRLA